VKATVLIPTFDHQELILRAIESVKRQTVQDFEVFVIGDGVPHRTRELVAKVCAQDDRFRFLDHPKGPRTGEIYRHQALQEARGEVVCYLADDDLWLPHHLQVMLEAGNSAGFFHTLHAGIHPKIGTYFLPSDLENMGVRRRMCSKIANRFGLSFGGHTLAAYRSLPHGWRTAPEGVFTDLHMWRQFLMEPRIRAKTVFHATALNFAAVFRRDWTPAQRTEELDRWLEKSSRAGFREELNERLVAYAARHYAVIDMLGRRNQRLTNRIRRALAMLESIPAETEQKEPGKGQAQDENEALLRRVQKALRDSLN